jgi:hypothetical protein
MLWFAVAILPGLLNPLVGVAGAVAAAWRVPQLRWLFLLIAALWLFAFLWFTPGGTTPGTETRFGDAVPVKP